MFLQPFIYFLLFALLIAGFPLMSQADCVVGPAANVPGVANGTVFECGGTPMGTVVGFDPTSGYFYELMGGGTDILPLGFFFNPISASSPSPTSDSTMVQGPMDSTNQAIGTNAVTNSLDPQPTIQNLNQNLFNLYSETSPDNGTRLARANTTVLTNFEQIFGGNGEPIADLGLIRDAQGVEKLRRLAEVEGKIAGAFGAFVNLLIGGSEETDLGSGLPTTSLTTIIPTENVGAIIQNAVANAMTTGPQKPNLEALRNLGNLSAGLSSGKPPDYVNNLNKAKELGADMGGLFGPVFEIGDDPSAGGLGGNLPGGLNNQVNSPEIIEKLDEEQPLDEDAKRWKDNAEQAKKFAKYWRDKGNKEFTDYWEKEAQKYEDMADQAQENSEQRQADAEKARAEAEKNRQAAEQRSAERRAEIEKLEQQIRDRQQAEQSAREAEQRAQAEIDRQLRELDQRLQQEADARARAQAAQGSPGGQEGRTGSQAGGQGPNVGDSSRGATQAPDMWQRAEANQALRDALLR